MDKNKLRPAVVMIASKKMSALADEISEAFQQAATDVIELRGLEPNKLRLGDCELFQDGFVQRLPSSLEGTTRMSVDGVGQFPCPFKTLIWILDEFLSHGQGKRMTVEEGMQELCRQAHLCKSVLRKASTLRGNKSSRRTQFIMVRYTESLSTDPWRQLTAGFGKMLFVELLSSIADADIPIRCDEVLVESSRDLFSTAESALNLFPDTVAEVLQNVSAFTNPKPAS